MSIDKAKLKALAKTASRYDWSRQSLDLSHKFPPDYELYIVECSPYTILALLAELDELKAENKALRQLKLPHYLKLSDEMRAAGDHAEQRAIEDQCYSVPVLKAVFFEAAIQRWLDDQDEIIYAAMAKEKFQ